MIALFMQDRLFVDAVIARPGGLAMLVEYRLHDGVAFSDQDGLLIDADKDRRRLVPARVITRLPAVIGVLVENRFILHAVVGCLSDVAVNIVGPLCPGVTVRHPDRFVVETKVSLLDTPAAIVVFRFPAMMAILVQYRFAIDAMQAHPRLPAAGVELRFHRGETRC